MTAEEFYGDAFLALRAAEDQFGEMVRKYREREGDNGDFSTIQYSLSRIKTPESMMQKLKRRGFPVTREAALHQANDALGFRIICPFVEDVYQVKNWLEQCGELEILLRKDYISYPKPNGYRAYHLIVRFISGPGAGTKAEIQLRTIALDFWASLEHRMKYKRQVENEELIQGELKRCADEIASVDLSMQTIRELVRGNAERE